MDGRSLRPEGRQSISCRQPVKVPINSNHLEEIFLDGRTWPRPVHLQIRQRTPKSWWSHCDQPQKSCQMCSRMRTRNSAVTDKPRDAFRGQSM